MAIPSTTVALRRASTTDQGNISNLRNKAIEAVFETYELIEHIILALPAEDILLAACVSKTFRHVSERSIAIRKHLYAAVQCTGTLDRLLEWIAQESWLLHSDFHWGILIIRRQRGAEAIAVLSNTGSAGLPVKVKFCNGRDETIKFERNWKGEWRVVYQGTGGVSASSEVGFRGHNNTELLEYLIRFH